MMRGIKHQVLLHTGPAALTHGPTLKRTLTHTHTHTLTQSSTHTHSNPTDSIAGYMQSVNRRWTTDIECVCIATVISMQM